MRNQTIDEQEHNIETQERNREDMDRRYEMEIEDRQNSEVIEEIVNTNYLYLWNLSKQKECTRMKNIT